jgi:hypothetical protein
MMTGYTLLSFIFLLSTGIAYTFYAIGWDNGFELGKQRGWSNGYSCAKATERVVLDEVFDYEKN